MAGAFQTSREIFDNPIWQNVVEFRLFFLIYGKATFTDGVRIGNVELKRGQWIRSYRNLQHDLEYIENNAIKRYSLATIKRAIDKLTKDGRLVSKTCEHGTLFEVVNYAKYQCLDNYTNGSLEQQRNSNETATKQQRNNNKNAKNAKNAKEDINNEQNEFFESIWKLYPNKKGKGQVSKTQIAKLHKVGFETLEKCIERYKRTKEDWKAWQQGSTFFNSGYIDYLDENYAEQEEGGPKYADLTGIGLG